MDSRLEAGAHLARATLKSIIIITGEACARVAIGNDNLRLIFAKMAMSHSNHFCMNAPSSGPDARVQKLEEICSPCISHSARVVELKVVTIVISIVF